MIDINKKYQTASGREVRLYATDGAEPYTVHGAILREEGWEHSVWMADGTFNENDPESCLNLVGVE